MAGTKELTSQNRINTAVVKFKRLLQCTKVLVCFTSFLVFEVFLNAGKAFRDKGRKEMVSIRL